jgi:hypothetical protein
VFRRNGRLLGTVRAPVHLEIQHIAAHALVALVRDDLGRARLELHHLVRPGPVDQHNWVGEIRWPPSLTQPSQGGYYDQ